MTTYDESHGAPYDRGRADFWYNRKCDPLTWPSKDRAAYVAGYDQGESDGGQKEWD